jgi:TetR/AcrR family transcriptional repressor of nem operon
MIRPADDTRQRIIEAALQLFWNKGYSSTSIADILDTAGANSGSLYHFFPGKQDLLVAVLNALHANIGPALLDPAWEGVREPIEKIFRLLDRYRSSVLVTEFRYGCPIGNLALELHEPDPPVRALLAANFAAWTAAVERCLDEAKARLPRGTDRRALATFVLTTMEGAVMLARTHHSIEPFDQAVQQLRKHFTMLGARTTRPAQSRTTKTRKARPPVNERKAR